jgi:hypothetical protein
VLEEEIQNGGRARPFYIFIFEWGKINRDI